MLRLCRRLADSRNLRDFLSKDVAIGQPMASHPRAVLSPPEPVFRRVFIEIYGCQMNTNDAEIVYGILDGSREGSVRYGRAASVEEADVALLMTCAVREHAETKI